MNERNIGRVIITESELQKRVAELGKQISQDYKDKHPVIVGILKGAFYFVADLTRHITVPINVDFLAIGVYPEVSNQTGIVKITKDPDISIVNRHVIMVEDIVGTGLTLGYLYQHLESFKPKSLKICTLLDNPATRLVNIPIDYCGFTVPDVYVVGYGLDYQNEFRHLPYIAEFSKASKE